MYFYHNYIDLKMVLNLILKFQNPYIFQEVNYIYLINLQIINKKIEYFLNP